VPNSFTSNGWSCVKSVAAIPTNSVTCTYSNPINPNTTITINVPVTPNAGTGGQVPGPITISLNGLPPGVPTLIGGGSIILITPQPHLTVSVNPLLYPLQVGQTGYLPVVITNVGAVQVNSPLTVNITLPTGISAPSSFMQGSWSCSTIGQTITCTNLNSFGMPTAAASILLVPMLPSASVAGTNPSVTITILPVPGQTNTSGTTIIYTINPAILQTSAPDLTVTVSQPSPALMANQNSTINVTVQNIGLASATGPLTVSFTLPNGFTSPNASFTSGAWTCNVVGQNVTCTNPNSTGLPSNGTSSLSVVIRPSSSVVGSTLNMNINVNSIIGETNTSNNVFVLNVNVPVSIDPNSVPNLNLVLSYNQSATYYQNTPFNLTYLLYNSSTMASSGMITVRDTLRFGLKFVSGSGVNWSINKVGVDSQGNDIIVATFNGSVSNLVSSVFNITVNPTMTGTIFNQAFVSGGGMLISIKGSAPCINCSQTPTGPIIINQTVSFNIAVKAILQGPYSASTGLMHDSLRVKNLIPLSNPYTTMGGFTQVGSGSETTTSGILAVSGSNAIVDWVLIELRNASSPNQVVATKAGLIQRDGDVVSPMDGTSALQFTNLAGGSYYVSIRHRNHLGAMSATPISMVANSTATLDLTNAAQPAYKNSGSTSSNYPQYVSGSKAMLWAGNAVTDNQIIFQGPSNEVDFIFFTVITDPLNTQGIANFIHKGYTNSDVNMDGKTVFQGPDNEVDIIFFNVLTHPENLGFLANYIIWQQMP
jgi:hypothetical protein